MKRIEKSRIATLWLFLVTSCLAAFAQEPDSLKQYRAASAKWEEAVAAWEAKDKKEVADSDTLLFLGSSSIRRWDTIARDMAPWKAIGRGYGGAQFSDLAIYAPRLLAAHQPKAVVVYVGNDITGKAQDKKPEEVVRLFGIVVDAVKKQAPEAEVFLIAITPAPSRFSAWQDIQEANRQLRAYCARDSKLHFIETHPFYLTTDGQPRPELYVEDRLHQNEDGYKLWSSIIKKEIEKVYNR